MITHPFEAQRHQVSFENRHGKRGKNLIQALGDGSLVTTFIPIENFYSSTSLYQRLYQ